MLDWKIVHGGWLYVFWLKQGEKKKKTLQELKRIEGFIAKAGFLGWIAESEFKYKKMHRVLARLGAKAYARDAKSFYFKKEINAYGWRRAERSSSSSADG